jgi:hypothetical protein
MRTILAATLIIGGAMALAVPPAHADVDYPVCLHVYGPVTYDECRYTSIEQCRPLASGRPAQCMINPFYRATTAPLRQQRRSAY